MVAADLNVYHVRCDALRRSLAENRKLTLGLSRSMTGFDVVLLGSFYGLPQFNEKYGVQLPDGSYTIKTGEPRCPLLLGLASPA